VEAESVGRPFLVMLNEPGAPVAPSPAMKQEREKMWADVISKQKTTAIVVKVENTSHFSFSDASFVVPEARMKKTGAIIAPQRGFEIITTVLRGFFTEILIGAAGKPLAAVAKDFPKVKVAAFGH
jgi:hypothetical protein